MRCLSCADRLFGQEKERQRFSKTIIAMTYHIEEPLLAGLFSEAILGFLMRL